MELSPGAQLGQYRIVEQIGRGGMATVFRAFQPALNRHVAIKVLPAYYADDPRFLERFRQEAQTVSQLRHPNILTVFDYGEQDGVTYMVSEYLPGGTLEKYLPGPLPLGRAVELLAPIASALDYAHARGMIHRDVKPSNILLTDDDTPVLADFGIARIVAGSNRMTGTGVAIGTPTYMAPEQAAGEQTTPATDRYALGIVLYELLTGRIPFEAETPLAVALAHLHKPLPLPRSINPRLPEATQDLLLKALAKDPAERFESARAMIEALATVARGEADSATTLVAGLEVPTPAVLQPTEPSRETVLEPPSAELTQARLSGIDHTRVESVPPMSRTAATSAVHGASGPDSSARGSLVSPGAARQDEALPGSRRRSHFPVAAGLIGLLAVIALATFVLWRPAEWRAQGPPAKAESGPPAPLAPVATITPASTAAPAPTSVVPAPTTRPAAAASPTAPGGPAGKPGVKERPLLERLLPNLASRLGAEERDDFSSPTGGLFAGSLDLPNGRAAYENSSLVVAYSGRARGEVFSGTGVLASRPAVFTNGVLDAEARLLDGPDTAVALLMFRRQPGSLDGYYVAAMPRRGLIVLMKQAGGERTEVGRARAEAFTPDGNNRLILVADGPSIQAYVNGQLALTASDSTFADGRVGLGAGYVGPDLGDVRVAFEVFRAVSLR